MSYPPYHHGPGYPPYPGSGPPPPSGSPYNPPGGYPNRPSQPHGVFPSSLGFKYDAPIYMPSPGYPAGPPPSGVAADTYPSGVLPGTTRPAPGVPTNLPSYPNSPSHGSSSYYPGGALSYPGSGSPYPGGGSSYPGSGVPSPRGDSTRPNTSSYPHTSPGGIPQPNHSTMLPYPTHTSHHTPPYPSDSFPMPAQAQSNPGYPSHHQGHSHTGSNTTYPSAPPGGYPGYGHSNITAHTMKKGTPTVVPAHPFDSRSDAEILRKAMKGFGTDEKAIISVLARRSNAQRLQIAVEFKTMYGKDLVKDLKSETSGRFEDLLVALMTPLPQFYAKELSDAIRGLGTDEDVLTEVLCTKSNNEIRTIRSAYHSMFGRCLEDDLRGDTSGTFKRLMVSLCNACRDESMVTNQANAAIDARELLKAGELRLGTDESAFNMVLCQRNFAQLRLIFEEYYKITGHDIEQAIKNEFSGNSKDCLLAIIRSIRNQPGFFAKCLRNSIAGLGTNDKKLIRVVVTRCEIDMGEIKQNYLAQYGKTLADDIKGDTSGDYKKCLLALIGES